MKITYKWLQEYVSLEDISPEQLADVLTNRGIPVETIEYRNQGVDGVVVGEVLATEQHPNADRLKVCQVNVGNSEHLQIVCGAPNVKPGQKVPVALVGAKLPGLEIKKAKLRGVESQGMLCSAKELGLETKLLPKEQTEGLFILPVDAPIGESIVTYLELDDCILDLELTPNRSDCLSMRGVAYEVAAILNRNIHMPKISCHVDEQVSPLHVRIDSENCRYYAGQVADGVKIGPSPIWMQMRLLSVGVRPISNIVDITNYVMFEYGQPLHAFDWQTIADQTIVVRQARQEENLMTLDGQHRTLDDTMLVIADPHKAIGLAGVMGGENSEVTSATERIVIESAVFDSIVVRKTGKALGLRSEAQSRFEKGIDPAIVNEALQRATALMASYAGAVPIGKAVTAGILPKLEKRIELSADKANDFLGTNLPPLQIHGILQALGFGVEDAGAGVCFVDVPSRRMDITLPVDLIEEVARMYGYDEIPTTMPVAPTNQGFLTEEQKIRRRIRESFISEGLQEVFTYVFVNEQSLQKLGSSLESFGKPIRLALPMSEERSVLRTSLLPSLLEVVQYNANRKHANLRLFEIGKVYTSKSETLTELPQERYQIAAVLTGKITSEAVGSEARIVDFYDAKGVVETVFESIGIEQITFVPESQISYLHPARTARILWQNHSVGVIGALHPSVEESFDVPSAYYIELDLESLLKACKGAITFVPMPKYPAIVRDIAVVIDRQIHASSLLNTIRNAGGEWVRQVKIFDVFESAQIGEHKKSVAITIEYRSDQRTLTDEEVQNVHQTILDTLFREYQAQLRA
ncbi:phenylalanine--tRNA ligase subunit beta [Fodinisporobacter ferrooxydans]|uniref:Phenylalanine--tRNA ligase beta subunit n=1 Tax=Fodinisporobacter ferrooxydans TaxID=2901836 RepID=A0ABY4CQB9_9BACL|nr:phenylalanine--tRNA ligase subunit beta [Alicyclobacillaceae bacterium MYW30-H2]